MVTTIPLRCRDFKRSLATHVEEDITDKINEKGP